MTSVLYSSIIAESNAYLKHKHAEVFSKFYAFIRRLVELERTRPYRMVTTGVQNGGRQRLD